MSTLFDLPAMVADKIVDAAFLNNVQGDIWSKGFPKCVETYYFFTITKESAKIFSQNLRKLVDDTKPLISSLQHVKGDWDEIAKLKKKADAAEASGHPLPEKETVFPVANALIAFTFKGLEMVRRACTGPWILTEVV